LIVWATILGASGAFLAIPLSLLIKSLLVDVDPEHDWVAPLLSSGNSDQAKPAKANKANAIKPTEGVKPTQAADPQGPST
jgi:hypothetical protein